MAQTRTRFARCGPSGKRMKQARRLFPSPRAAISFMADVQYRNAVHWCETLRLNREKTMQAGHHVGVC